MQPTSAQRLLGLFVVGQLSFLLVGNALDYLCGDEGDPLVRREGPRRAFDWWARLSGQWQEWKLFAPEAPTSSRFATLELHGPDGAVRQLRSEFEPVDPSRYWRPPGAADRSFNFEANIAGRLYVPWDAETLPQQGPAFQQARRETLRRNAGPTLAYLRWRLASVPAAESRKSFCCCASARRCRRPGRSRSRWRAGGWGTLRWRCTTPGRSDSSALTIDRSFGAGFAREM